MVISTNQQPLYSSAAEGDLQGIDLAEIVLEHSHDGIYITDGYANTLRINKSYETISSLFRDAMLGRNMNELVKEGIVSASGTLLVLLNHKPVTMTQMSPEHGEGTVRQQEGPAGYGGLGR